MVFIFGSSREERGVERASAIIAIALARKELNRQGKLPVTQHETTKRGFINSKSDQEGHAIIPPAALYESQHHICRH